MIDKTRTSKHVKKIFETTGAYFINVYFCSFLMFFKIFRTSLKNTLLNKKLTDFIVVSITTSFPDIYYDCLFTKKSMFSIYLFLLKSSYKIYKNVKKVIINYVSRNATNICEESLPDKCDFNSNTITCIPSLNTSLHIYIDDISFYNLYEI